MNDLGAYGDDSFFTLTAGGQIGLALLSLLFWAASVAAVWWVSSGPWRGVAAGLAMFVLFVWLSPQLYYVYYWIILDGLPVQIVVKMPPGPAYFVRLLTFTQEASLSRHGQGVLGWSLIAIGLWGGLRRQRRIQT